MSEKHSVHIVERYNANPQGQQKNNVW